MDYSILKYVGGFTSYFILGWYIKNFGLPKAKLIYLAGILGFALTLVGAFLIPDYDLRESTAFNYLSVNVLAQSAAIFLFIKNRFESKEPNNNIFCKFIGIVSKYSLGMFAIHVFIKDLIVKFVFNSWKPVAPVQVIIIFLSCFVGSLILSWIISKIPYVRKIVV